MTSSNDSREAIARHWFDKWSRSLSFRRLSPWLRFIQGKALDQIDWSRVDRVLDVACGTSWAAFEAARRIEERKADRLVCGCDISKEMLKQGRSTAEKAQVSLQVANAEALPYESEVFDAVICTAAFHHFASPNRALEEFRRVLRPGGKVVIADSCRDLSPGTWIWDRLHRWFEASHKRYYRTDELRSLMAEAGFETVYQVELRPTLAESNKLFRRAALFGARKSAD